MADKSFLFQTDALSASLDLVRCRSASVRVLHPPASFAVVMADSAPTIHIVDAGCIRLSLGEHEPAWVLNRGDLALVLRGAPLHVQAGHGGPLAPLDAYAVDAQDIHKSLDAPPVEICWVLGELSFDDVMGRRLLHALPPVLVVRGQGRRSPWLDAALGLLVDEARCGAPGAAVIASRVLELVIVYAVRTWSQEAHGPTWVAGAMDERIGRAIAAIHAQPERAWTVQELASLAAMSRSSFAERFRQLVGEAPAGYVSGLRLDRAAALLRASATSVGDVAHLLGYASVAVFARAFRARFGVSATQWRKAQRGDSTQHPTRLGKNQRMDRN